MRFIICFAGTLIPLVVFSTSVATGGIFYCPPLPGVPHPGGPCPRFNPNNGHFYAVSEYFLLGTDSSSWDAAKVGAESLEFIGIRGHLATITTASEEAFIRMQLVTISGITRWIGASDRGAEGDWRWMTGPEAGELFWRGGPDGQAFGYSNWQPGEPNDSGQIEDYAVFGYPGFHGWNDYPDKRDVRNYIVEFSVPEPSSYALLSIGGAALAIFAHQRRSRR